MTESEFLILDTLAIIFLEGLSSLIINVLLTNPAIDFSTETIFESEKVSLIAFLIFGVNFVFSS